eukprot:9488620-Pyramimonas_sp.AAC.1
MPKKAQRHRHKLSELLAKFLDRPWRPLGSVPGAAPGALSAPGRGSSANPRNPRGPPKIYGRELWLGAL